MGLENRDYYRNSRREVGRPSGLSEMPTVCKRLLIANIVVFILQIFVTRPMTVNDLPPRLTEQLKESVERSAGTENEISFDELAEDYMMYAPQVSLVQQWCSLDPAAVAKGQVWRLVTCAFCHDRMGVWHIVFNMLFLFWFGTRLEQMYGPKEFALFYFASAIASSLAFLLLHWYTGDMTPAVGASGAVWGVVALYALHHPYERIYVYFLFPIEIRWLVVLYLIFDLHPVLLALNSPGYSDGVAHAAHLGGAAFGFLYYKYGLRLTKHWNRLPIVGTQTPDRWQAPRKRSRSEKRSERPATIPISRGSEKLQKPDAIPMPTKKVDIELEIQLDDVLAKISREGRDSLTNEEVAVLDKASNHFKKNL